MVKGEYRGCIFAGSVGAFTRVHVSYGPLGSTPVGMLEREQAITGLDLRAALGRPRRRDGLAQPEGMPGRQHDLIDRALA